MVYWVHGLGCRAETGVERQEEAREAVEGAERAACPPHLMWEGGQWLQGWTAVRRSRQEGWGGGVRGRQRGRSGCAARTPPARTPGRGTL